MGRSPPPHLRDSRFPSVNQVELIICFLFVQAPHAHHAVSLKHQAVLIAVETFFPPDGVMQHFQNHQFQRWATDQKRPATHRLSDVWKGGKWLMHPVFDLNCLSAGVLGDPLRFMTHESFKPLLQPSCHFKHIQPSQRNYSHFIAEKHSSRGIYWHWYS